MKDTIIQCGVDAEMAAVSGPGRLSHPAGVTGGGASCHRRRGRGRGQLSQQCRLTGSHAKEM